MKKSLTREKVFAWTAQASWYFAEIAVRWKDLVRGSSKQRALLEHVLLCGWDDKQRAADDA